MLNVRFLGEEIMKSKVFGHRGFSGRYPENTMLSFERAITEAHVDGIELDVHLTKDNQLVIIHDETLNRATDGLGLVKDYSLLELEKLNASGSFYSRYGVTRIPTFEEYCSFIQKYPLITNVEIKSNLIWYQDIEEKTYAMLSNYGLLDRVIISSFNHSSIMLMKDIDPSLPCGLLVDNRGLGNVASFAHKLHVEYYHPDIISLKKETVDECTSHGVWVNAWTVNDMASLSNCVDWHVDGIITNYPDIAKVYVDSKEKNGE